MSLSFSIAKISHGSLRGRQRPFASLTPRTDQVLAAHNDLVL